MKMNNSYLLISELYTKHPDVFVEQYFGVKLFRYQRIMLKMMVKSEQIKQNMRRFK